MSVSTRTRFEIFKRDGFTCQYCGNKPPAVILHADHILAVSLGGETVPENLITSCAKCNLGKSNVPLGRVVQPIKQRLQEEKERSEQVALYNQWLREIREERNTNFETVSDALILATGSDPEKMVVANRWAASVKTLLKRLPAEVMVDAVDTANDKFSFKEQPVRAFRYFCGICWRTISRNDGIE